MSNEAAERLETAKAGFRSIAPATIADWVLIDGTWHSLAYVWGANDLLPTLYIDGTQPTSRGETAYWDRVLSEDEIRTLDPEAAEGQLLTPEWGSSR